MRRTILVAVLLDVVGALVAVPISVYASHSFNDVPTPRRSTGTSPGSQMPVPPEGATHPTNAEFCPDDEVEQVATFLRRLAEYIDTEDDTRTGRPRGTTDNATAADEADIVDGTNADDLRVVAVGQVNEELAGSTVSVVQPSTR